MLEKVKNIEPEQSIGIILLALLLSVPTMDIRFWIPAAIVVIATIILSLYKMFTNWRWALSFLGYLIYAVVGIAIIIALGGAMLLFIPFLLIFFGAIAISRN